MHRRGRMLVCAWAGVSVFFSAGALGGSGERFAWSDIAPRVSIVAGGTTAGVQINPLADAGDGSTLAEQESARGAGDRGAELSISGFGVISAPDGLGTIEHAIGELAIQRAARGLGVDGLLGSSLRRGVDEIEFPAGTPSGGRLLARALLAGTGGVHAEAYRAWVMDLTKEDLSWAVDQLSTLVDARDGAGDREERLALDAEDEANLRTALSRLRELEMMAGDDRGRDGTSFPEMEDGRLGPTEAGRDRAHERDRDAIRRVFESDAPLNAELGSVPVEPGD